jgi:putative DNA primase/helicase
VSEKRKPRPAGAPSAAIEPSVSLAASIPRLTAEHLEDLRRSGLTDETIADAGIRTLSDVERQKELGALAERVSSAYLIPYPGCETFHRLKLFPPLAGMKYSQPRGSSCRLYLTPGASSALHNPSVELFVVEGEKKALRLHQEGLASIGIGGIWNWRSDGRAIEDFAKIDFCERVVILVPDSDTWTRDDLRQAVFALGKEIESRGGKVAVLKLPQDGEEKCGADDYLQSHAIAALLELPRHGLRHAVWSQTREWWREWIKSERKASAEKASAFADVAPAESEVDGAALLEDLRRFVSAYIVMAREAVLAAVLWVLTTWTLDAYTTAPILNVSSPAKRCGKTRFLECLALLVKRPLMASNVSAAAVFRSIERWNPTLLIDEADTFINENDELRGVLNSSHYRSGAFVVRVVGEQLEPQQFSTWCAKAIAGIGKLKSDTLDDRSIRIPLKRKAKGDSVSRLVHTEAQSRTEALRRRCARWGADHLEEIRKRVDRLEVPGELDDRAADNWRPLLSVAELCGVRDKAREVAIAFGVEREDESASVLLLEDLREILDGRESIHTETILEVLREREDRPWPEWGRGKKPITGRGVAKLLEPYGIRSRQLKIGGENRWGYRSEDFDEAFLRYLSLPSATSHINQHVAANSQTLPISENPRNTTSASSAPSTDTEKSSGVVDKPPISGTENGNGLHAVRVLAKFGGRLQRGPLLIAIRRECAVPPDQAEILLGLAIESGRLYVGSDGVVGLRQ